MKKYKIILIDSAKKDVINAVNYYKNISLKLGNQFLDKLKKSKIFIQENPNSNDIMYKNIRTHFLKQFPYNIHYMVDNETNIIVIIAVEFAKRENQVFK